MLSAVRRSRMVSYSKCDGEECMLDKCMLDKMKAYRTDE